MSMLEFLKAPFVDGPTISAPEILLRLLIAALFGGGRGHGLPSFKA